LAAYGVTLEGRLRIVYYAEFTGKMGDSLLTYYLCGF
jgi:hypothetical protein